MLRHEVEDPVEQLGDGDAARPSDERALDAITLRPPFVLDRNRPVDHIKPGIVLGMRIKEPGQRPI